MAISYEQAVARMEEWTASPALRNHSRAVEAAMRQAAHRYGRGTLDEPRWALAGLLHDADYDRWPEEHPRLIVAWLLERAEPELAQAITAHFDPAAVPDLTTLDKALLACDELSGFVMACCLVRPEGIRTLSPSSVKKKLKDKSFAAKINRNDVYQGAERLQVNLDEHIQLVIDALSPHADALGIAGIPSVSDEVDRAETRALNQQGFQDNARCVEWNTALIAGFRSDLHHNGIERMATIQQIRDAMHAQPFRGFTVKLVDGQSYTVKHPDFVAVPEAPRGRDLVVHDKKGMHLIDLNLVVEVEVPAPTETPERQDH